MIYIDHPRGIYSQDSELVTVHHHLRTNEITEKRKRIKIATSVTSKKEVRKKMTYQISKLTIGG